MPSGHRRFHIKEIEAWLGVTHNSESLGTNKLIAMIRVSSRGQATPVGNSDKSSLDHQRERIVSHCITRYNRPPDLLLESIGSGLNFDRPELLELVRMLVSGDAKGGVIVATDFTRICRFGIQLVEYLAKIGECRVEFMDDRESKSFNETLTDDVLAILTHYTAKASGEKTRKALKVVMDEDSLQEAYRLQREGYSYRHIEKVFNKQRRGDGKGRRFTRGVIRVNILENLPMLESLLGKETRATTSFDQFCREHVRKGSAKLRLSRKTIIQRYRAWIKKGERGQPLTERKISLVVKRRGWPQVFDVNGCVVYCGLSLVKGGQGQ
ncbi:MAG: recombinase family protein [Planctomycetota bacterium]